MTLDEAIKRFEKLASDYEFNLDMHQCNVIKLSVNDIERMKRNAKENRQLAEWLEELQAYREFADWLVKAVLEEDWEESADFYAEVLCRKLTKLGKLKVINNKYMEVNADADSD